jgi:hypothetical protein
MMPFYAIISHSRSGADGKASPGPPEVPTFQKAGIKGLVIEPWFGVFVSAGTAAASITPELCKFQRDADPGQLGWPSRGAPAAASAAGRKYDMIA